MIFLLGLFSTLSQIKKPTINDVKRPKIAVSVENLIIKLDKKDFKSTTLGGCIFFKKGEYLCLKTEKR